MDVYSSKPFVYIVLPHGFRTEPCVCTCMHVCTPCERNRKVTLCSGKNDYDNHSLCDLRQDPHSRLDDSCHRGRGRHQARREALDLANLPLPPGRLTVDVQLGHLRRPREVGAGLPEPGEDPRRRILCLRSFEVGRLRQGGRRGAGRDAASRCWARRRRRGVRVTATTGDSEFPIAHVLVQEPFEALAVQAVVPRSLDGEENHE